MNMTIISNVGLTVCGVGMLLVAPLYTGCETTGGPPAAMSGLSAVGYAQMAANPSLSLQQRSTAAAMSRFMSAEAERQHELEMVRTAQVTPVAALQVGQSHPQYRNVIYQGNGKWKPTSGYRWVNPSDPQDLSVLPLPPIESKGFDLVPFARTGGTDERPTATFCKPEDSTEFYRNTIICLMADMEAYGGQIVRMEMKDQNGHCVGDGTWRVDRNPNPGRITYKALCFVQVREISEFLAKIYQQPPSGTRRYQIELFLSEERIARKTTSFTINHDVDYGSQTIGKRKVELGEDFSEIPLKDGVRITQHPILGSVTLICSNSFNEDSPGNRDCFDRSGGIKKRFSQKEQFEIWVHLKKDAKRLGVKVFNAKGEVVTDGEKTEPQSRLGLMFPPDAFSETGKYTARFFSEEQLIGEIDFEVYAQ